MPHTREPKLWREQAIIQMAMAIVTNASPLRDLFGGLPQPHPERLERLHTFGQQIGALCRLLGQQAAALGVREVNAVRQVRV